MKQQMLIEHLSYSNAKLCETKKGTDLFLSGIMMQAELENGNRRRYPLNEISNAVNFISSKAKEGHFICGELNHPDVLTIDLKNVSHSIVEATMRNNDAVGKMKLLNTPSGNIARGLIEGGIRLGVSSRGTGNVNESGEVSGFNFVTMDIVYQPSAPDAYPDVIQEAYGSKKVMTLAEAMVHDQKAQKYFKKAISDFIVSLKLSR